jgi:hypothetical protein
MFTQWWPQNGVIANVHTMVATKSLDVKIFLNVFAALCNKCIYTKNEEVPTVQLNTMQS